MSEYSARVVIDNNEELRSLHSIEKCRTMVLQDSHMDYRSTIYSMITDIDEDDVKQQRTPELDSLVWHFPRLVQIDGFVRDELNSELDEAMENKLSGGQKTRLLLTRDLFRTEHREHHQMVPKERHSLSHLAHGTSPSTRLRSSAACRTRHCHEDQITHRSIGFFLSRSMLETI